MFAALVLGGCKSHPMTDYRPLVQAGMSSEGTENLKTLNTSDSEIAEAVKLKNSGISDDMCVELIRIAHGHQHLFTSSDSVKSLSGAHFTDEQILQIAKADKLDTLSGDVVMYRLIGLSPATVQMLLQRRLNNEPTLSSGQIARLKNVNLTEKDIVARIEQGMTDQQADAEATAREKSRNNYNLGFKRIHGRRR